MLSDIKTNDNFELPVYIKTATIKISKNGKEYITGEVLDKTEILKFFLWDSDNVSCTLPKTGMYAMVTGKTEVFNGNRQITLFSLRELNEAEIDINDFKKSSQFDLNILWQDLIDTINLITDPLIKKIADSILEHPNMVDKFKKAPAALSVHNAWVGGLIEHSVCLAKLSINLVDHYNANYFKGKIDKNIVIFSCLFHDIGKIWEYDNTDPDIKVTMVGELLGHIYMGTKKIADIANECLKDCNIEDIEKSHKKVNRILHAILAHHGKFEWGAPVVPKTPEAIIVHYLDNLDTKIMNAWEEIEKCKDEFTSKNYIQENARLVNIMKE